MTSSEDADDLCAALDLAIDSFDRVCRMKFRPVLLRKGHVGEHVLLGTVHESGEFRHLRADLVGDIAPLGACGLRCVLGEGRGDEGGDDAPAALSGMGERIAHEVNTAPLLGRGEYLGDGYLDALMRHAGPVWSACAETRSRLSRPRTCRSSRAENRRQRSSRRA